MAEEYAGGVDRRGVKLKLLSLEGTSVLTVGRLALYLFCVAMNGRSIVCRSVSITDSGTAHMSTIGPHRLIEPPTSRCFSCDCESRPKVPGEAAPLQARSIFPVVSSVQTDESNLLPPGASKTQRAERKIYTKGQLPSLARMDVAGTGPGLSSARQAVLRNNFRELQQLLEEDHLRNAAQDLFREVSHSFSASALPPVLNTLKDWSQFDFVAFYNLVSGRPADQGDGSSVAVGLTRDMLIHYHQLANLSFLTLSLESSEATAEVAKAPQLEGETSRARLFRKLAWVAGEILGFSEFTTSSGGDSRRVPAHSTSEQAKGLTEQHLTSRGNVRRSSANAEGVEYSAIDIRGLTGTANPFLFLRFLLLGVALTGFERHFDKKFRGQTLPFFGPDTFLSSLSSHHTPQLFDAMTKSDKTTKKKGTFVSRLLRRISASAPVVQSWGTLDISGIPEGNHKLLLSILRRHLEATLAYAQQQLDTLKEAKVPVELSLSFSENMHRLHTFVCLSDQTNKIQIPCAFEDTNLHKSARVASELVATDDETARREIHQQDLKTAFLTVTGLDLSVWSARLFSDPLLGAAANKWFMYDNEKFSKLLAKFNSRAKAFLAPYGLQKLLKVRKRDTSPSTQDVHLVERALRRSYDRQTALRACLYAFMLIPRLNPYQRENRSPLDFVKILFAEEHAPMLASAKVNPVTFDDLVEHGEPYGHTFMWLFEFLSVEVLLRRLPPDWQNAVTQVFRFTAHTTALQQVTTFHSLFRIKNTTDVREQSVFRNENVVKSCEDQIYKWSRYGFAPAILEADKQNRSFEEIWRTIKLENMPTPDVTEWWRRLHFLILQGLKAYLVHEKYLEGLEDNIYTIAADTVKRMEEAASPDGTFFLARVGAPTRQSKVARYIGKIKRAAGKLLREVPFAEHVVWLGVSFDRARVMVLLTRLRDIAQSTADAGTALLLDEAFLELVAETIQMKTTTVLRHPLPSLRTVSVLSIRPDYAKLSSIERAAEFDHSLCAEHCVQLWQVILAFVYPALLDPSKLSRYEKEFSRAGAKRMLNSPDYVNSFRYVFASDAALDFWDYTTPSHIKEGLQGMDEGQSLMYANMMRLAGHFFDGSLGLHNLGHTLQMQAPFMGQTAKDWIRKRRAARKQAIFAALTLGLMFVYTVASSLQIFSVMKDVGMTPIEQCSWNAVAQEMACIPVNIGQQSVTAPLFAALTDVFHIGVYAGIGSTIMSALGIGSVYAIVRSESRKIMRMEMVLCQVVVKLWRRITRFASKALAFVRRRETIIATMMTRATAIFNKKGQAYPLPQVHETGLRLVDSVLEEQPQLGPSD